jgi:hypothetical protein
MVGSGVGLAVGTTVGAEAEGVTAVGVWVAPQAEIKIETITTMEILNSKNLFPMPF